jgi:hypothetical protein
MPIFHDKNIGTKQKALRINLDRQIYGSFAEIGAGQDTAANFFKAGGASGTIAKTMSAYDMTFSDAIYGTEESGRYVCESRLNKMLNHEYGLLEQRLGQQRGANTQFFAFANTVVALNYQKTNEGHGWLGLRFQLTPNAPFNDVVIHVRLLDNDSILQQQALGIIGVNLIYGCFYYHQSSDIFLQSLADDLNLDRFQVDMIRVGGHDFQHFDNRLLSLNLVKLGFTEVAMFGPDGGVLQPSEALYKKNILLLRGRLRPITNVHVDMLRNGLKQFKAEPEVDNDKVVMVAELTLQNLRDRQEDIDEKDFLDRVDILSSMGETVMISNYQEYHRLVAFIAKLTRKKIGLVLGVPNLHYIFDEQYYQKLPGGILESFSTLFSRNVKLFVYPTFDADKNIMTCQNFEVAPHLMPLFQYLAHNDKIEDIRNYNETNLHINTDRVLELIKSGEPGWEAQVPAEVVQMIQDKCLFGFPCVVFPPKKTMI